MISETTFISSAIADRIIPPTLAEEGEARIEALFSKLSLASKPEPSSLSSKMECIPTDPIQALFASDRLLARAMEREVLSQMNFDANKLCFDSFINEMTYMQSEEKLRNASCTLLVSGEEVTTYKPYGFLFDAGTSDILHVAIADSYSCTNNDGSLIARGASITIPELADFVRKTAITERASMNEVNANFAVKDIKGLFVCRAETNESLLEILAVKEMLKEKYRLELPLYLYNAKTGQLTLYAPDKGALKTELMKIKNRNQKIGQAQARALAPYLGFKIDERGRLS